MHYLRAPLFALPAGLTVLSSAQAQSDTAADFSASRPSPSGALGVGQTISGNCVASGTQITRFKDWNSK